jgi:ParB-like chromosome segregation protein Spo0J
VRPADELRVVAAGLLGEQYGHLRLPQPRLEQAVADSMARYGQISPLVACERESALAVVDGFKRLHAAQALGLEALTVRVMPLPERAAVAAVLGLNRGSGSLMDIEEALVVRELCRKHGLTQVEVGALLDRHKSWVCRRLSLVERLDEQVQDDLRVGLVPVSLARELVRLPRGNQPEVATSVHRNGLTVREGSLLISLVEQTSDRPQQKALVADPRRYLEAHQGHASASPKDPRLGPAAARLRWVALGLVEGLARCHRQTQNTTVVSWTTTERALVAPLLVQVEQGALGLATGLRHILAAWEVSGGGT